MRCLRTVRSSSSPESVDHDNDIEHAQTRGDDDVHAKHSAVVVRSQDNATSSVDGLNGDGTSSKVDTVADDNNSSDDISDMLRYLETHYRDRLLTMLLQDVKQTVTALKERDDAIAAAAKEKERRRRILAGRANRPVHHQESVSAVAAREKIQDAERSSRRLIARM